MKTKKRYNNVEELFFFIKKIIPLITLIIFIILPFILYKISPFKEKYLLTWSFNLIAIITVFSLSFLKQENALIAKKVAFWQGLLNVLLLIIISFIVMKTFDPSFTKPLFAIIKVLIPLSLILPTFILKGSILENKKIILNSTLFSLLFFLITYLSCHCFFKLDGLKTITYSLLSLIVFLFLGVIACLFKEKHKLFNVLITKKDFKKIKSSINNNLPQVIILASLLFINVFDMFFLNNHLKKDTYEIVSIYSFFSPYLLSFILFLNLLILHKLLPKIKYHFRNNEIMAIKEKISRAVQFCLFMTLPLVLLISILAKEIWPILYGPSSYGILILSYSVFLTIFISLFLLVMNLLASLKENKYVYINTFLLFLLKILLTTSFFEGFQKMGIVSFYGLITCNLLLYLGSTLLALSFLGKKYRLNYEELLKNCMSIFISCFIMGLLVMLLEHFLSLSPFILVPFLFFGGIGIYLLLSKNTPFIKQISKKNKL